MLSRWSLLLLGLVAIAGVAAACEGLSPGDQIIIGSTGCTVGFVVANADALYFSTAGHCVQVDERVSTPGVGEWGTGVFHFLEPETGSTSDGSPGYDFALIRIDPDAYSVVNPKICGWDGPTGIYTDTPGSGGVQHWGHGTGFGDLGPTGQRREGFGVSNDGDAFYWLGAGVPGDSGSAVISTDGRALGILTHLTAGIGPGGLFDNGGTHLERGFRLAAEAGFTDLRLVLAGEDPIAVLASLRGPQALPPTEPTTPGNTTTTSPAPEQDPPRQEPAPTPPSNSSATPPSDGDGLVPAATSDDEPTGTPKETPIPWSLALLAITLVVFARRRKG